MLIYLLRHGQTEYNAQKRYQGQRDIPLSPEGAAQLRRADVGDHRRQVAQTPLCIDEAGFFLAGFAIANQFHRSFPFVK